MQSELTIDALAQEIRHVDGNHSLGAGALAEALMPFLTAALSAEQTQPVAVKALEWLGPRDAHDGEEAFDAYSSVGHYVATGKGWFITGQTGWNISDSPKAAAQADYETRIRSALVDVPAEPVAIGYVSSVELHLLKQSATVVDLFSKPEPGPIEFIPVFTSPPVSREGEDTAEVLYRWRGPRGGWIYDERKPKWDCETLAVRAATRSGSASTSKGGDHE